MRSHIRNETNDADLWAESEASNAVTAEPLNGLAGHALISSAEEPPAKTSASPAAEQDSEASDPAYSSSSPGSPMSLFGPEDGSSLRTFPDFFPALAELEADETSRSYLRRWPTSGFTTSPGECWTAATSECPSGGDVSSSLPDVLLDHVPSRFFLSPRAAAGILRRAEKRGRELPQALHLALTQLASTNPDDAKRTTSTSSTPSTDRQEDPTTTAHKQAISSPGASRPATDTTEKPRTLWSAEPSDPTCDPAPTTTEGSSPTPSDQRASMPARTGPDEERPSLSRDPSAAATTERVDDPRTIPTSSVRRLTPTECERLQGFPDQWTVLPK